MNGTRADETPVIAGAVHDDFLNRLAAQLADIPLPGPTFMITVARGSDRRRRLRALALRALLWGVPAGTVYCVLTDTAGWGGHQPLWVTMMTTCLTLFITISTLACAVTIVGVRDGGGEDAQ